MTCNFIFNSSDRSTQVERSRIKNLNSHRTNRNDGEIFLEYKNNNVRRTLIIKQLLVGKELILILQTKKKNIYYNDWRADRSTVRGVQSEQTRCCCAPCAAVAVYSAGDSRGWGSVIGVKVKVQSTWETDRTGNKQTKACRRAFADASRSACSLVVWSLYQISIGYRFIVFFFFF